MVSVEEMGEIQHAQRSLLGGDVPWTGPGRAGRAAGRAGPGTGTGTGPWRSLRCDFP
jgi:hypothetical protein